MGTRNFRWGSLEDNNYFFTVKNQVIEICIKLEKILTVENLDREKCLTLKILYREKSSTVKKHLPWKLLNREKQFVRLERKVGHARWEQIEKRAPVLQGNCCKGKKLSSAWSKGKIVTYRDLHCLGTLGWRRGRSGRSSWLSRLRAWNSIHVWNCSRSIWAWSTASTLSRWA